MFSEWCWPGKISLSQRGVTGDHAHLHLVDDHPMTAPQNVHRWIRASAMSVNGLTFYCHSPLLYPSTTDCQTKGLSPRKC